MRKYVEAELSLSKRRCDTVELSDVVTGTSSLPKV